jgi:hypothetical protein
MPLLKGTEGVEKTLTLRAQLRFLASFAARPLDKANAHSLKLRMSLNYK